MDETWPKAAGHGYKFDDFILDLDRRCLWRAGQEVKLRPKSLEVLKYLIERHGRLVSKAEMMEAVWPDTSVTDDSLVQCLMDVRRALQDDAQRYIKTIPRQGYLFDAVVTECRPSTSDAPATTAAASGSDSAGDSARNRWRSNRAVLPAFVIAVLLLAGLAGALVWRSSRPRSANTLAEISSIAVLPFKSIDAEAGDEYLGLGMADDLITRLSNLRRVIVRPTSAVLKYAVSDSNPMNPVTAGRELGVESVLEGNIRTSGERIRVTVQLVDVRTGSPLWAEKFDERFTDILSVQDAVAEHVSRALVFQLTGDERRLLTRRYTNNPEAYQHYLRGRYFLNRRTEAAYQKSLEHFQQAIKLDKSYAPAYAGLADGYIMMGLYLFAVLQPHDAYPKAKEAAAEALRIDDALGEAHAALGYAKLNYDWTWTEVERELKRAIELKPDYGHAQHNYSHYLMVRSRVEESLAASLRALELDPLDLTLNAHLGWHFLYARQYDRAAEQLLKTIELDPSFVNSYFFLGMVYEQKGMNEAAVREFSKAVAIAGEGRRPAMEAALGHAYAVAGKRTEAERLLDGLKAAANRRYISPYSIAVLYAGLGDKEQAFAWLNRAYEQRDNWLIYLNVDPRLDALRSDARFADLLRRIGLAS
jgi:TolB-like protein/DNA-binding winged helix-turn-helix (wHTH) protein/tetratricopeptide (TPR) repeat protein